MEKAEINLVILSPSPEANKLTFSSIPTTTTIAELQAKICAAATSHPAPELQRLIYRGHALKDVKRTLKDIFTQEIITSAETLSLHLVLPPETSTQPGTSSTHSSIPRRGQPSSTPQQTTRNTNGMGSQSLPPGSGPTSTTQGFAGQTNVAPPHTHVDHLQAQHGHVHGVLPNGPFPPQLQQALAQFQAVNQHLAAQLAAIGTNPGLPAMAPQQVQAQPPLPPNFVLPTFQDILAQQQQQQQQQSARAAGEQTGLGSVPQPNIQANQPGAQIAQHGNSHPGNANTVIRENHGPNGERWQMVIQSGQVNISPHHNFHNHAPPSAGNPRRASPVPQGIHPAQTTLPSMGLMHLQLSLSAMEAATAGGNPLSEVVFEQARQMLSDITDLPREMQSSLDMRLNDVANRAHHLRENLNSHLSRATQERVRTQRTNQGVESSAVYILSSPSGPQALLVSPTGLYSTPWQFPSLGSIPQAFVHHDSPGASTLTQPINLINPTNGQGPHVNAPDVVPARQPAPQQVNVAEAVQARQQQQVNQARDFIRILLPLGGHLWLLIRLFGFVYFFTAGAGWRRTILLGLVACLVFVAQTGIFRPVIQAIWDPIRRHAEGLVPLAANERPPAAAAGAGDNANTPDAQPANREPTPQEAAERLLQEREGRDVSFLRQSMRRIERAIALFVASLVPGVGERHIAAREAAEAARQTEIRERENQACREEEERQRREGNTAEMGENNASAAGGNAQAPGQEQAAQPPLIEV